MVDDRHRPQLWIPPRKPLESISVQPEGLSSAVADGCARRRPQLVLCTLRSRIPTFVVRLRAQANAQPRAALAWYCA